ncbi:hypothetical protein OS493_038792 [Desmophyllum pertusum]|uniref:Uncharacterized protein n=1 Tax=Desmophyllum pertusum TaxID=174260 RepID=A0A9X0CIT8_9CNID|nr:hypothetical protein OS493_038792 [Desmophyllum pertusum]
MISIQEVWFECNNLEELQQDLDAFHGAFAYKNPCSLTFADFKPYFDEVGMQEIHNKADCR